MNTAAQLRRLADTEADQGGIVAILARQAANELEQMRKVIAKVESLNDNPARFISEINDACNVILRPDLATPEMLETFGCSSRPQEKP